MAHDFIKPIIGQEAICPDGLGRVTAYNDRFPNESIAVSTYVRDRECSWAPHNVILIDVGTGFNASTGETASAEDMRRMVSPTVAMPR